MEENTVSDNIAPAAAPVAAADAGLLRWLSGWAILLSDVLLFSSAVNCLFRWLSYGYNHDGAAFILSLALGLAVYFTSINSQRFASPNKRLLFAVGAVLVWAVFMPLVMRLAGFN